MTKLDGKVAVITGSASGIGKAAAGLFVSEGAKVFLTDVNGDALEATAKEIGSKHVAWSVADVTSADDNNRMVAEAVERFGGSPAYTTSKHAVTGLVRSAAKNLAPMNIRVNSVNPGPVQTPLIDRLAGEVKEWLLAQIPMGRYATPEEIANVMLFLASDDSSIVTGHIYLADGGYRA